LRQQVAQQGGSGYETPGAPGGSIAPGTFRPLAGAIPNNRGNARAVTLQTLTGGPAQVIPSILQTKHDSGVDAEVLTVQLGLELPQDFFDPSSPYTGAPVQITALLEWGVGGSSYTAEVDWILGTCFYVTASWLRISAIVGAVPALAQPNIDITLKCSVGYGNANGLSLSSAARRIVDVLNPAGFKLLNPGETSRVLPIPLWAMGFTLIDGNTNIPDYTISQTDGVLIRSVNKWLSRSNVAIQVEGQFPVPGMCRFFTITNNLGVIVANPSLIFNLGF
jgi:hypothetical protein